jgi:hypothetical protein
MAAITAARVGAKVGLLEWRGCLGGVWTAGLLGYFLDFDKPGFAKELREKLDARDARANSKSINPYCYDHAALKLLLEELCVEAGVKFQFHTRVCAAFMAGRRSVNSPRGVAFDAKGRMLVLSGNPLLASTSAKATQAEMIIAPRSRRPATHRPRKGMPVFHQRPRCNASNQSLQSQRHHRRSPQ